MKSEDTKVEVAAWRVSAPSDCGWLLSVGDEHYYFDGKFMAMKQALEPALRSRISTLEHVGGETLSAEAVDL